MTVTVKATLGLGMMALGILLGILRGFGLVGNPLVLDGATLLVCGLVVGGVFLLGNAVDVSRETSERNEHEHDRA